MKNNEDIAKHYTHGNLLGAIKSGLGKLGKTPQTVSIHDLAPVDEFHIGGRAASEHFIAQLEFLPDMQILDIGCGLGGGARFSAQATGAQVTGIDLTGEYIETGQVLNSWVGLEKQVTLKQENALAMSFENGCFDGAYMMHVAMNIADKQALFEEVFRVLKPGARFGIYDIMRTGDGELAYPVPWADSIATSHLSSAAQYMQALVMSGFEVEQPTSRRDFALAFFAQIKAKTQANGGPPPLGLHTLMRASTGEKLQNMVKNISARIIAPVEMIARKPNLL